MILAWNDTTLEEAYALFKEILEDSAFVDENGKTVYGLPANLADIHSIETKWVIDFPKPEAEDLILAETVDVYDDSVEYIYTGTGATAANYEAYCAELEQSGYLLNNENVIEESRFRTYVNSEAGVALHVTLALYTHADEYEGVDNWPESIRVVASPLDSVNLLDEALLTKAEEQTYTKLTDSMLTSVEQDRKLGSYLGTSYVLTLEDGSFFIVDGGQNKGNTGHKYLWNALNKLYLRTHGHEPTEEEPIVIAGWLLTHPHVDHTETLRAFCEKYGTGEYPVKLEYFFANLPSESEQFNVAEHPEMRSWKSLLNDFAENTTCIKVHSGYKFCLRNVEFEVLYTHEDMHPFKLDYVNETSVVMRATINHTDGNHVIDQSVDFLITGDMGRYIGCNLMAMYGSYLATEIMAVAHHGWVGPYREFYDVVQPKILWWTTCNKDFVNMVRTQASNHSWYHYRVDYYIRHDLESVKYIFVQDDYDHTLYLRGDGINYENILEDMFDLMDEETVTWGTATIKK